MSGGDGPEARGERDNQHAATPVTNELGGVVHGSSVQARDISGGVHFAVPRAQMPVPAQLPPATANFTGRQAELAALDRVAAEYEPARRLSLAVIIGAGGSGKTSLASHWLHRVSERYEGGVLYAELNGHVPDAAVRPGEVLEGYLRALGAQPEQVPLSLGEQAKLFRTLTSGRRMLMLLDNAASAAQVRALLPGPGPRPAARSGTAPAETARHALPSLVVVTTRWRITGLAMDGARFIELGPLDGGSAAELLTQFVGRDRAEAEAAAIGDVARLCGGLPLALSIAGAQLATHARWPVSRIVAHLASEQHRLEALSIGGELSVRATFDVSYGTLPTPAARVYRLLSLLFAEEFGYDLAAAACGIGRTEAAGLLDTLVDAFLLEEVTAERYRFHDLIRLHARERARAEPAPGDEAVTARTVDWYLGRAVAADFVILPIRWRLNPMYDGARAKPPAYPGTAEALSWLESELPGLQGAVRAAHDAGLHERAWQLCEAMWGLFGYRKYFRAWIDTHLLGIDSAIACGDNRAEGRMRVQLGHAYLNLGRQESARAEFERALQLARQDAHQIAEATALEQLGLVDLSLGRPDQAIVYFTASRDIMREIGRPRGVMMMTRHIGEAHRDAGRAGQAVRDLLEARRLAAALPDRYNEARALIGIGKAHLLAGQPEAAVGSLTEALEIAAGLGARYEQARIRVMLADALLLFGQAGSPRDHLTAALAIYAEIGAPEAAEVERRLGELTARDETS
jgi:tetratricopeptide (TPR) repeat protein